LRGDDKIAMWICRSGDAPRLLTCIPPTIGARLDSRLSQSKIALNWVRKCRFLVQKCTAKQLSILNRSERAPIALSCSLNNWGAFGSPPRQIVTEELGRKMLILTSKIHSRPSLLLEPSPMCPNCTWLPRTLGANLGLRPLPAPTNHDGKTGSKHADFDVIEPQWTRLAARVVPYAPRLYPRLPPTIGEHLGRGPPRTWELNFRSDFLRPLWDAPI
jgi:hypothetical protein